jgi:hypothetical protein
MAAFLGRRSPRSGRGHTARGRGPPRRHRQAWRRGTAFPRLLRLPPPWTAARRLLDEASDGSSKGRFRAPPLASPSSSLPSSPSFLPSLVAANLGEINRRRGTGSCDWGLGSYRWSARVWSPRGTAGILGVRACGHATRIRGRQHDGGGSHGGGAAPWPTARVTPVTGWKTGRKGEMGKGLTRGPHM